MTTQTGVGISHHRNPIKAGQDAVAQAIQAAGLQAADPLDFIFVFASMGYNQAMLLRAIREAAGHCPLAGCSGAGVIGPGEADESNFSVAVMVVRSDELRFHNHWVTGLKADPEEVGKKLAHRVNPDIQTDAIALFLFPDGLTLNFDRLAAGLNAGLIAEQPLPWLGGAAGSDADMKITYQYCDDQIISDGVVATLMAGQGQVAWAVNHGCIPVGVQRTITRAAGNVIYEIDGKPALEILQDYLTDEELARWDETIVTFCLGFQAPSYMRTKDEYIIRYLPAKDEATGAVIIQTEVEPGSAVWVTRRDAEKISQGLDQIATTINAQIGDRTAKMVLHFDCYGRGKFLFRETEKRDLLNHLQAQIGSALPWLGFYAFGEIAPIHQYNTVHNYTLVLAVVY